MTKLTNEALTIDELTRSYYGEVEREKVSNISAEPHNVEQLTASGRHVLDKTREHLSELQIGNSQELDREQLLDLISEIEEREGEDITELEKNYVVEMLASGFCDYGVLTPLVENEKVNDVIVKSYNDVSIQSGRANIKTDVRFSDNQAYRAFVENLLKSVGKSCTTGTPIVDAALDKNVRVSVVHDSVCPAGMGPFLTLRVARHKNITLEKLQSNDLAPAVVLNYLASLARAGEATILIAGEVGTGKTTLVRALANGIYSDDSILVIEDTHELSLHHPFVRTILTREANTEGAGRVTPAQAIRAGMRMAMNRVILGEMRDAEAAESFIDVCASGHPGMSTIHSRSARDAISRLELFLSRAQAGVGIDTIRKQISNAVSVIVYLGIDKTSRKRRVKEVIEVYNAGDGNVQTAPIFNYLEGTSLPQWKRGEGVSVFEKFLLQNSVSLPRPGEVVSIDPDQLYRSMH